jgi:hypothetical protein
MNPRLKLCYPIGQEIIFVHTAPVYVYMNIRTNGFITSSYNSGKYSVQQSHYMAKKGNGLEWNNYLRTCIQAKLQQSVTDH